LTYSQRSSVLALLFKKGDPLLLDNFKLISLLNVHLKIFIVLTQFTNESLKPKRFKVNNIKSHSNESKAFIKSIKTRELDNFRPISLLNVDLKILSHVLAQRLKKILSKLINEAQAGCQQIFIITFIIGFNKKICKLIPKGSVKFNRKTI
jgi:hypothetical protein